MNTNPGILGTKLGVTQHFLEDGNLLAVTAIQAGCVVVGKRTQEKDGYDAVILGLGERKEKHTSKAVLGSLKKVGQSPKRYLRELRASAEQVAGYEVGQELKVDEVFEEGQMVDVQSTSKGSGFTGVMKRYNFAGAKSSHGAHEVYRHGGSIGTTTTPGRVMPGKKMAGQHGNQTVTVLNLRIVKVLPEKQMILVKGGVPGAKGAVVRVQGAVKRRGGKKKS